MARAKVIVSAGVLMYINGTRVGTVTSFKFSSQTPKNPVHAIDSLEPFELVPVATKVTGSVGLVRTLYDGGAEGLGVSSQFEDVPREKYFSVMLVEHTSDTILFQADYCSLITQNWDFEAKNIVRGTIEFEALDWRNEYTQASKA